MDQLLATDPSWVGGHRLVARLGAGGMGVVYLARSPHGAWVALKVIRSEYAEDPDFLARFRRETELATRLSSRWTVPVLTADAEARSPWLATAYVPGLPLSEALALHGPWPLPQVRTLAAALAAALDDVHRAGLVHRDMKPANVLLAADGPRLIDFGIALAVGATALTADGSVIGSPGYLSPEQARGTTVGPAGDVFSLGCVLVHALTGRPPFGAGGAAAVLYRTVHEEPDLAGLPPELDALLRSCLAKSADERPTVAGLRELFGAFDSRSWLPGGLPAVVAERAGRVLDLPVPEPTALPAAPVPDPPPATSRRRLLAVSAALGVGAIGGGTAWWRWGRPHAGGGTGRRTLPTRVIGLLGDRSTEVVRSQERGAGIAVAEHNSRADRAFDLALRAVDDLGTAAGSAAGAARLAGDPDVHAVIGAGTNQAVPAAVPVCTKAGVCLLVTRADTTQLNVVQSTSALLLRSTRTAGPGAVVRYLNRVVRPSRTVVVHDLADEEEGLPTVRIVTVHGNLNGRVDVVQVAADEGFTAAAQAIAARPDDAVLFAGITPSRAAACAKALRAADHRGVRAADEYVLSASFLREGEGWWIGTGYADAGADPRLRAFATAYRARHGGTPGPWAAEAYDAVRFAAHGLAAPGGDGRRESLRAELLRAPWQGVTRRYSYESQSQYLRTTPDGGWFLYHVQDGTTRFVARQDDIGAGT
ncbi:protein kinase [Streptomyces sp. NPDC002574]|uniref:protein kinase domain-containing protein n=1 Tax=Streptomyces sp. NPDC002574 TaxID=3364652 RepID=UPI0036A11DA8